MRFFYSTLVFSLCTALCHAQPAADQTSLASPAASLTFEVASFKLNKSGLPERHFSMPPNGDGFTAVNFSIRDLLRYAFANGATGTFGIYGEPRWMETDRYNIQAKVAPEQVNAWQRLNDSEKKLVVKEFLIHSLALKYHPDDAIHPFYALIVASSGLKMKQDTPGQALPTGRSICHFMPGNQAIGESCSMDGFAAMLSTHTDFPVLDRTGLNGRYSFTLVFDTAPIPGSSHEFGPQSFSPEVATPLIRSSVKQLGLELHPDKGLIDGIVIDSAEHPAED